MQSALRILVVDDRLDTVADLVEYLQGQRHVVDTSDNSMEALSLIGRKSSSGHAYHLMITDMTMPLLDGVGLARELRRRNERVQVAFVTSYASSGSKIRQEAIELGIIGIITKPLQAQEIEALLSRVQPVPSDRLPTAKAADNGTNTFFGTARITRPVDQNAKPQEGALARARLDERDQAAPVDLDALVSQPSAPRPTAPAPETIAPEFLPEIPESSPKRVRTPDPGAFYQPNGALGTTSSFYKRPKSDPFTPSKGAVDPRVAPPPPGTARDPVTGNYRRTPSGLHQGEPNPVNGTTTPRFRRTTASPPPVTPPQGNGLSLTPLGQQTLPPTNSITSGFRRSLTGKTGQPSTASTQRGNPTPAPVQTCTVSCAHCSGIFQVIIKPVAYTVLCVHCGQLNRIDPLPGNP